MLASLSLSSHHITRLTVSIIWVCILLLQINTSFVKFIWNLKFEMNRSNSENFASDDSLDMPPREQDRCTVKFNVTLMFLSRNSLNRFLRRF